MTLGSTHKCWPCSSCMTLALSHACAHCLVSDVCLHRQTTSSNSQSPSILFIASSQWPENSTLEVENWTSEKCQSKSPQSGSNYSKDNSHPFHTTSQSQCATDCPPGTLAHTAWEKREANPSSNHGWKSYPPRSVTVESLTLPARSAQHTRHPDLMPSPTAVTPAASSPSPLDWGILPGLPHSHSRGVFLAWSTSAPLKRRKLNYLTLPRFSSNIRVTVYIRDFWEIDFSA